MAIANTSSSTSETVAVLQPNTVEEADEDSTMTSSSSSPMDTQSNNEAVENILRYKFKNKSLLEEALTHPSIACGGSYQRLEFVGDAALGLAFSNHIYLAYPDIEPGQMTLLRSVNVSTEKLARVAVKWNLFQFVNRCPGGSKQLCVKVKEFAEAVQQEDESVLYGGSVKAPKVLADIVEAVAAAVYVDLNFDLQALWVTFRHLLEPIVTLEELRQQPQPVTMLFNLCQKQGKRAEFRQWRNSSCCIYNVYIDGVYVSSSSSRHREIAKLDAAKGALQKLKAAATEKPEAKLNWMNEASEIDGAKHKLQELCEKKKWLSPTYKVEKPGGLPGENNFVCSVQIQTEMGVLHMDGHERPKLKKAENSAASFMIHALTKSGYL